MSVLVSVPPYVTAPDLPGVPDIIRQAGGAENVASSFYAVSQYITLSASNTWGVYDSGGNLAVVADSVNAMQYHNEFRISDYPQEEGAFASYNKVQMPFEVRVKLTRGGSVELRTQFLAALESLCQSMELYSVITPDVTYQNVSFERFEYERRNDSGARLIIATLHGRQVRPSPVAQYGLRNTQNPASQDVVNDGSIQTQPLPTIPNFQPTAIQ